MVLILRIIFSIRSNDEWIASPKLVKALRRHTRFKLPLLISPIPVDNSVHSRFLVMESLPSISDLRWTAAFLTTAPKWEQT
jgi:hypothetical protein